MKAKEKKKKLVEELAQLIQKYPVVGIADLTNLPSSQFQKIRAMLKDNVLIKVTKKSLIARALEIAKSSKSGIEKLEQFLHGIPAMVFSNLDSFKLSKTLDKNKTPAPAKPGQIANEDIIVNAGETPFTPGPIIGELGQLGIKTSVEGGKIVIKEDKLLVKAGETINDKAAALLAKLGIQPMKIGINLVATFEDGTIYKQDVLKIDEARYFEMIKQAYANALNLSINIAYPTKENIKLLILKASAEEKSLFSKIKEKFEGLSQQTKPKESEAESKEDQTTQEQAQEKQTNQPTGEQAEQAKSQETQAPVQQENSQADINQDANQNAQPSEQKENAKGSTEKDLNTIESASTSVASLPKEKFEEYSQQAQKIIQDLQDNKTKV